MSTIIPQESYKKALLIRRTEDTFLDLFDKGKMTLKFEDEDKIYACYLEEDR